MRTKKISAYLGFAIKSRKAIFGYDNLFVSKKLPYLVLVSNKLAEKMKNKVFDFCKENNITIKFLDISVGELIKRDGCKVISILDKGLADAIMNEMEIEN